MSRCFLVSGHSGKAGATGHNRLRFPRCSRRSCGRCEPLVAPSSTCIGRRGSRDRRIAPATACRLLLRQERRTGRSFFASKRSSEAGTLKIRRPNSYDISHVDVGSAIG